MAEYDPETLNLLRTALEEAWALVPEAAKSETQKSDVAHRLLMAAAEGVRDPVELRVSALTGSSMGGSQAP